MGSFNFLSPIGLALAGLIAPLILLYILKVRRKRAKVSSTWLWRAHARDLLARSPIKKLIAQLSLVLQILALVLLALALARPASLGAEQPGSHVAIVLDLSASMGTQLGEPRDTALERAKDTAHRVLDGLPPGSQALLIEAGVEPRIVAPLDRDLRRVANNIDASHPLEVEGDLGAAVAIAVDKMKAYEDGKVIVLTDAHLARPLVLEGAAVPVEVLRVGSDLDNAAIVRADVRVGYAAGDAAAQREQVQAFLLLANYATATREVYVTMRREGADEVLDSRRLTLEQSAREPVVLTTELASLERGAPLIFEITPGDALPVDDHAFGVVPPGEQLPVTLATTNAAAELSSIWMERALRSDPRIDLTIVRDMNAAASATKDAGALLIVQGACPDDGAPGGDLLIVDPPAGKCWDVSVGDRVDAPLLSSWESADARLRFLTLDGVNIAKSSILSPPSASMSLVRAKEGVLASDASTTTRTVTMLGFDPGDTDWPFKASFVLFVRNVTELARTHRAAGPMGSARTGEALRVALPKDASNVQARGPDDVRLDVSVRGGIAYVPPPSRVGIYRVSFEGEASATQNIAVNLTSAAESDLRTRTELPTSASVQVRDAADVPLRYRDLAWILGLVVLAVLLFEVWYFTRERSGQAVNPHARAQRPGGSK